MKSFDSGLLECQPITQNLLRTIRLIGEYKGKQELFKGVYDILFKQLTDISWVKQGQNPTHDYAFTTTLATCNNF